MNVKRLAMGAIAAWIWATIPISFTLAVVMMVDYVIEFAIDGAIIGSIYKKA